MRSDQEITDATRRFHEWANTLTADDFEDASDLRDIAETAETIKAAEAQLRARVELSRAKGRTWGEIGVSLGVSKQAARERFNRNRGASA